MSNWYVLSHWEALAISNKFKQNKSNEQKQYNALNNRKAFISKKHNLNKGKH